jgi:hypothetical protein
MSYKSLTVSPAYGRDYKSKKAVLVDWNDNKDFTIQDMYKAGMVNKQQVIKLKEDGYTHIHIHYKQLTQVMVLPI